MQMIAWRASKLNGMRMHDSLCGGISTYAAGGNLLEEKCPLPYFHAAAGRGTFYHECSHSAVQPRLLSLSLSSYVFLVLYLPELRLSGDLWS